MYKNLNSGKKCLMSTVPEQIILITKLSLAQFRLKNFPKQCNLCVCCKVGVTNRDLCVCVPFFGHFIPTQLLHLRCDLKIHLI